MDNFVIREKKKEPALEVTQNVIPAQDAPARVSLYKNAIVNGWELCRKLINLPDWEQRPILVRNRPCMQNRKTCFYANDPNLNYKYSGTENTECKPFPVEVQGIKAVVEALTGVEYNYCLMNLYEDGSRTIGWHSDKEGTLVKGSPIASVSLGAARFFDLRRRDGRPFGNGDKKIRLNLQNGTLIVMWGETQSVTEHQVPAQLTIKEPRVNLTFRVVQPAK